MLTPDTTTGNNLYSSAESKISGSATGVKYNWRYIQSSPPYDLGDGEVAGFVYATVDNTGTPLAWSVSEDPPWAYDGPTRCRADLVTKDGRKFVKDRKWTMAHAKAGEVSLEEYLWENEPEFIEITQERKQRDMNLIPSYLQLAKSRNDRHIVLLDPMSKLTERLASFCNPGDMDIYELLECGRIKIDSEHLNRAGPEAIPQVGYRLN